VLSRFEEVRKEVAAFQKDVQEAAAAGEARLSAAEQKRGEAAYAALAAGLELRGMAGELSADVSKAKEFKEKTAREWKRAKTLIDGAIAITKTDERDYENSGGRHHRIPKAQDLCKVLNLSS
jgi:hypothetical protein